MQIEALMPPGLVDEGRKLIEASVPKNAEGAEVKYLTTLAATLALVAVFERGRAAIDFRLPTSITRLSNGSDF